MGPRGELGAWDPGVSWGQGVAGWASAVAKGVFDCSHRRPCHCPPMVPHAYAMARACSRICLQLLVPWR